MIGKFNELEKVVFATFWDAKNQSLLGLWFGIFF